MKLHGGPHLARGPEFDTHGVGELQIIFTGTEVSLLNDSFYRVIMRTYAIKGHCIIAALC